MFICRISRINIYYFINSKLVCNINQSKFQSAKLFIWTSLYILMAVTLYLIWTKKKNVQAERWFYLQLILNTSWSVIFFGLRQPLFAFIDILTLWFSIIGTIYWTKKTTKTGAYLLIPYLLWVTFASILNFYVVLLN
jgi:translocator protein